MVIGPDAERSSPHHEPSLNHSLLCGLSSDGGHAVVLGQVTAA